MNKNDDININNNDDKREDSKEDMFRDTWIRYLGYTNEIGEAFRPIIPKFILPSYMIAIGYMTCDTIHKTLISPSHKINICVDTMLWQALATVILPGITINRSVYFMNKIIQYNKTKYIKYGPTLIGMLLIPIIITPIDIFVDWCLDNTTRRYLYTYYKPA